MTGGSGRRDDYTGTSMVGRPWSWCLEAAVGGAFSAYHGRLAILSQHGPGTEPLDLPLRAEVWSGSGFVPNARDHCTVAGVGADLAVQPHPSPDGRIPAPVPKLLDGGKTVQAGQMWLCFACSSGDPCRGCADVEQIAGRLPWLGADWDALSAGDQSGRGRASFGARDSSSRLIYRQENFR